jgi:hypothetical protein
MSAVPVRAPQISRLRRCVLVAHAWQRMLARGLWRLIALLPRCGPWSLARFQLRSHTNMTRFQVHSVIHSLHALLLSRAAPLYHLLVSDNNGRAYGYGHFTGRAAVYTQAYARRGSQVCHLLRYVTTLSNHSHSPLNYTPLSGVTPIEAKRFHKKYRLPVERDVFVRGVLALRSQDDIKVQFENIQDTRSKAPDAPHRPIELRVGEQRYTRLESDILYKAFLPQSRWETLRSLSRLHWLLIVACIFAAMTQ